MHVVTCKSDIGNNFCNQNSHLCKWNIKVTCNFSYRILVWNICLLALFKALLLDLKDFFFYNKPPPPPLLAARIHTSCCSLRSPCSLCLCSSPSPIQNTVTSGKQGGLSSLHRELHKQKLFLHLFMTLSLPMPLSLSFQIDYLSSLK